MNNFHYFFVNYTLAPYKINQGTDLNTIKFLKFFAI